METTIISVFLGVGLAAAAGFRVFLPLFALSVAAYFGFWPLNEDWSWVGGLPALLTLGVATVVEAIAYLIPWVDNLLDAIAIPLAGMAGTAAMISTLSDINPAITWALAIIAGGGTATAIKSANSGGRLLSSTSTAGVANPLIAVAETGVATVLSVASLVAPIVGIILVFLILVILRKVYRIFSSKSKATKS